jgi:bifunctional DNA-binding transcriptional regulator/antitoxin component of YhaV-PrlF toxin-antitoxin module
MTALTLSSKGQVTLPIDLRRRYGFRAHDRLVAEAGPEGIVIKAAPSVFDFTGAGKGRGLSQEKERDLAAKALAQKGRAKS